MHTLALSPKYPLDDTPKIARIGLLALSSDFCLEDDLRLMLPEGVQVYTNRVTNQMPLTPQNLRGMRADIARAAQALLPGGKPHLYIYGCTSGTAAIGYETICHDIRAATGQADAPVVTPLTAAFDAINRLKIKRLSLLTPYTQSVSHPVAEQLQNHEIEVVSHAYLGLDDDYTIHRTGLQEWREAAIECHESRAEGIFISCTSTRAALIAEELETALGCPVITSNQALAFATMDALGLPLNIQGYGRLLGMDI